MIITSGGCAMVSKDFLESLELAELGTLDAAEETEPGTLDAAVAVSAEFPPLG